jgi:hypothetical protein
MIIDAGKLPFGVPSKSGTSKNLCGAFGGIFSRPTHRKL